MVGERIRYYRKRQKMTLRELFLKNYYRKKRKSHTTFDMGIEEDNSYREHKNPEDEGILYDNLD